MFFFFFCLQTWGTNSPSRLQRALLRLRAARRRGLPLPQRAEPTPCRPRHEGSSQPSLPQRRPPPPQQQQRRRRPRQLPRRLRLQLGVGARNRATARATGPASSCPGRWFRGGGVSETYKKKKKIRELCFVGDSTPLSLYVLRFLLKFSECSARGMRAPPRPCYRVLLARAPARVARPSAHQRPPGRAQQQRLEDWVLRGRAAKHTRERKINNAAARYTTRRRPAAAAAAPQRRTERGARGGGAALSTTRTS